MTREEAINAVGLELVEQAERDNCCLLNSTGWQGYSEFAGYSDYNENMERVVAIYYQPDEVLEEMRADGNTDFGGLTWEIDHYEVI